MVEISIKEFLKTLTEIFKSSPTSVLFIVVGLVFIISMIINIRRRKTIGWPLSIIGWVFIIVFIIIKYNSYLAKLFDNLINFMFKQILFPNLATYILIIIISNIIYIYSSLKKGIKIYEKIINSIFFVLIMFLMIYTLEQILENKLNVYKIDIYKNQNLLILVETTTFIFVIWMIFLISKKAIVKLINLSNRKIEKRKALIVGDVDGKKAIPNDVSQSVRSTPQIFQPTQAPVQTTVSQGVSPTPQIFQPTQAPVQTTVSQSVSPTPQIFQPTQAPVQTTVSQNVNPTPQIFQPTQAPIQTTVSQGVGPTPQIFQPTQTPVQTTVSQNVSPTPQIFQPTKTPVQTTVSQSVNPTPQIFQSTQTTVPLSDDNATPNIETIHISHINKRIFNNEK